MCYAPWSVFQDGSDVDPNQAMPQTIDAHDTACPETSKGRFTAGASADSLSIPSGSRREHRAGPGRTACISPQRCTNTRTPGSRPGLATDTQRVATSYYGGECIHTAPDPKTPPVRSQRDATTARKERPHAGEDPWSQADGRPEVGETEHRRSEFPVTSVFTSPVSRTLELSLQSSFHLSLTVLVRYRSRGRI